MTAMSTSIKQKKTEFTLILEKLIQTRSRHIIDEQ